MKTHSELEQNAVKYWWFLLITGVIAINFGIWFLVNPYSGDLALSFAVSLGIIGLSDFLFTWMDRKILQQWKWIFGAGIVEFALCLTIILFPKTFASPVQLGYIMGGWMLLRSLISVKDAYVEYQMQALSWIVLMIPAVTATLFSLIYLFAAVFTKAVPPAILGIAILSFGLYMVLASLRVSAFNKRMDEKLA